MAKVITDGIARLQTQSRIPAATWRQWCSLLHLDPAEAVEVWEEICYPIMLATRKVPEITYILQLRAERLSLGIFDFKEEIAKVLHFFTFLFNLQDEQLVRGKLKTALVKFYKHVGTLPSMNHSAAFVERFINDLCAMVLVAKVIDSEHITLSGVIKTIGEGRGTLDQVIRLAKKSLDTAQYGELVQDYFVYIDTVAKSEGTEAQYDREEDTEESYEESEGAEAQYDREEDTEESYEESEGTEAQYDENENEDTVSDELDPLEEALVMFKTALHTIYEAEADAARATAPEDMEEAIDALLDTRIQVIARFSPLQSTIPSVEEAQEIARRAEVASNRPRIHRATAGGIASFTASLASTNEAAKQQALRVAMSGGSSSGGAAILGGGGGSSSKAQSNESPSGDSSNNDPSAESNPQGPDTPDSSDRVGMHDVPAVSVEAEDVVELSQIQPLEFNDRVRLVATLLSSVKNNDNTVWGLVLDPTINIENLAAFARTLALENTPANQAYNAVKALAQCLPLKQMLPAADKSIQRERNFSVQTTTFVNQVKNVPETKEIARDNRLLGPLKTILDHASTALLRLEALKTNYLFSESRPTEYSTEATMVYYEEALRAITDLTARQLLTQVREKADADTASMFAYFGIRKYAAEVIEACQAYAETLVSTGQTASVDQVKAAIAADPVQLSAPDSGPDSGELPAAYSTPSDQGELFDTVAHYLYAQAWQAMRPVHMPDENLKRLQGQLRQILASVLVMRPERKRHVDNSRFPIAVAGLDKISGNPNLKDLFVRVQEDGRLLYIEGYEDDTYLDIFELRKYKPMRMQGNAQQKAAEEGIPTRSRPATSTCIPPDAQTTCLARHPAKLSITVSVKRTAASRSFPFSTRKGSHCGQNHVLRARPSL
jgi:hypothetical protein